MSPNKKRINHNKTFVTSVFQTQNLRRKKRKETEKELGRSVTSKENYLAEPEKRKKLQDKSKKKLPK
mgnify:CR=1 FL=1